MHIKFVLFHMFSAQQIRAYSVCLVHSKFMHMVVYVFLDAATLTGFSGLFPRL